MCCSSGESRSLCGENNVFVVMKIEIRQCCFGVLDPPVDSQFRLSNQVPVVVTVAVFYVGDGVFLIRVSAASA
jgi:hypothetical protein